MNLKARTIFFAAVFAFFALMPGASFAQSAPASVDLKVNGFDGSVTVPYGSSIAITWTSANAFRCTVAPNISSGSLRGSKSLSARSSATYTATCSGLDGSVVSDSVSVTVQVSVTADIKANGSDGSISVRYGEWANLVWGSTGAVSCVVEPLSLYGVRDSKSIKVVNSATYTLKCQGPDGSTVTDSVSVSTTNPPQISGGTTSNPGTSPVVNSNAKEVTITASPQRIQPQGNSIIAWSTRNMNSCTASGGWSGGRPTSGSETVFPNVSTEYILTCVNGSRTVRESVIVYVGTSPVVTGNTGQAVLTMKARNLTAQESQFADTVKAQGLDNVEFEIWLTAGASGATQMSVLSAIPKELFYLPASAKINGVQIPDGIAEANGIFIGDIGANETKIITFTAVVFYGVAEKTLSVPASAKGSAVLTDSVDLQIANRGQVLGASDVVTGPEHLVLWVILAGFLAAIVLYVFLYNRRVRMAGKHIHYSASIAALRVIEKHPDV